MNESTGPSGYADGLPEVRSLEIDIRRYQADDAPALVTLYNDQETESGPRDVKEFQRVATEQEGTAGGELWVAQYQGTVAGYAAWNPAWWTGRHDTFALEIRVERGRWGRGIGSSLYGSLVRRPFATQATRFLSWIRVDLAEAQRFAARHGFEPTGQVVEERRLHLPDARDEYAAEHALRLESEGLRISTLAELQVDEQFLHRLRRLWSVDEAGDELDFAAWRSSVLDGPGVSPETHWLVLDGERPIGTTFLKRLGPNGAENDYTAVAPEYRGRGIASALKHRAIAWGREHGIDWFYTSSLLENGPMHAVNHRLGYLPGVRKQEVALELEAARCR